MTNPISMKTGMGLGWVLAILFLASGAAVACMWDSDTLAMERQRFPTVLELITGKFLRHSFEFHQWRIRNRLERMKATPDDVALANDLAVSYEKTGQRERAIEVMLGVEARSPKRYETAANLGTFYIHAGRYEDGVTWIDRALQINPEAHFGRERYQKMLVLYMVAHPSRPMQVGRGNFVAAVIPDPLAFADRGKAAGMDALKGVTGMMKFGNFDSPVLLEALGDLLSSEFVLRRDDGKQLATRAYLQASYQSREESERKRYRALAERALELQVVPGTESTQLDLGTVEAQFREELDDGRVWFAGVEAAEREWLRSGVDPEAAFARKYYTEPLVAGSEDPAPARSSRPWKMATVFAALVVGCLLVTRRFLPRRS